MRGRLPMADGDAGQPPRALLKWWRRLFAAVPNLAAAIGIHAEASRVFRFAGVLFAWSATVGKVACLTAAADFIAKVTKIDACITDPHVVFLALITGERRWR